MPTPTSRQRFDDYRETVRVRNAEKLPPKRHHGSERSAPKLGSRDRGFWELVREFWRLIGPHHRQILIALFFLTIAIGLRLVPPVGTKLAIDCVLTDPAKPLPAWLDALEIPTDKMQRLVWNAAT